MRWSDDDIVREVGRGALGVVSECKVNTVQLACKEVMVTSAREHDTAAAMLLKEVRALAGMHHPNIVRPRSSRTMDRRRC